MAPPKLLIGRTPYNPQGYVPGGAPISVAKAIVKKAAPKPIYYDPSGYVRGGASPQVAQATVNQATSYGLPPVTPFYTSPTAPTTAPSAPSTGQTPVTVNPAPEGVTEDMIAGDWEVQEPTTALAAQISGMESGLGTSLSSAFTNLGISDPKITDTYGKYITPEAVQKAVENKYSTGAQISKREREARANTEAVLAARGMLSSGYLTNQLARIASEGEGSRYKAVLDFLGLGEQGINAINEARRVGNREIAQARNRASQRLGAGLRPGGNTTTPLPPNIDVGTYPLPPTPPQITQPQAQQVFDDMTAAGQNPNPVLPSPTPWGDYSPSPYYTPTYAPPLGAPPVQLPYGWNTLPGTWNYT